MGGFYESHPYPPPADDLDAYRGTWDDRRRRAESHLFWPGESYRDDRAILVAGCGTTQAAHYAVRWPRSRVVGIDLSEASIAFASDLKRKHGLVNLELRRLSVERAAELGERFDRVVCTGVLHHLPDPDAGLSALREALAPGGAMHLMVYAPYGRAGVYMLQEYCRRLRIGWSAAEIDDLAKSLRALPPDHPIVPLLRSSPDFSNKDALADALLHPIDRAYSVAQLFEFLRGADLAFGRWIRQAPYLPVCGAIAGTPHAARLATLPEREQYAMLELFRGTMVRHAVVAYRTDLPAIRAIDFGGDQWLRYVPMRREGTVAVRERLPAGAAAVLINRNHTYTDLYLPIDSAQEALFAAIDGERSIAQICGESGDLQHAREFFERLWLWDQVVFDATLRSGRASAS
ncbi:MAG TPA: methyltransferase [Candidatus Binatia bacterium]|nr:methyltransferase [Candidatus Binatia bacterium]